MKKVIYILAILFATLQVTAATPREFYMIRIYHCDNQQQINHIDQYLKNQYLPFLHKSGIKKVGVFAPVDNDTSSDKRIFVWFPLNTLNQIDQLDQSFENIDPFGNDPLIHLDNKDSSLPYNRIENIKVFRMSFVDNNSKRNAIDSSTNAAIIQRCARIYGNHVCLSSIAYRIRTH